MVYWQKFDPSRYEYEFDEEELAAHAIEIEEAMEVFWHPFDVRRNKSNRVGYQIVGVTDGGRRLKLIVYEKSKSILRVITGWPT